MSECIKCRTCGRTEGPFHKLNIGYRLPAGSDLDGANDKLQHYLKESGGNIYQALNIFNTEYTLENSAVCSDCLLDLREQLKTRESNHFKLNGRGWRIAYPDKRALLKDSH